MELFLELFPLVPLPDFLIQNAKILEMHNFAAQMGGLILASFATVMSICLGCLGLGHPFDRDDQITARIQLRVALGFYVLSGVFLLFGVYAMIPTIVAALCSVALLTRGMFFELNRSRTL